MVVSKPDPAVAVGANVGSPSKQQHPAVGVGRRKILPGGTGHMAAVKIVHRLMADHLPIDLVIDRSIVLRPVG